jgi:plasmid maintenance system killer protein
MSYAENGSAKIYYESYGEGSALIFAHGPGNRLEPLKGGRKGQYSIRINDQFRVCFSWTTAGATNVEIVDYH